jgi:hypothetical protein
MKHPGMQRGRISSSNHTGGIGDLNKDTGHRLYCQEGIFLQTDELSGG